MSEPHGLCKLPGSPLSMEFLQQGILEWVAVSFRIFLPRDRTGLPVTDWAAREAHSNNFKLPV